MLDPWTTVWICTVISIVALVADALRASSKPERLASSGDLTRRRQKSMVFEDLEDKQS